MKLLVAIYLSVALLYSQELSGPSREARAKEILDMAPAKRIQLATRCNEQLVGEAFETAFYAAMDQNLKGILAQLMVLNGSRNKLFREYLISEAEAAVDSTAPSVYQVDSSGTVKRGSRNPGFERWCELNGKNPDEETLRQLKGEPMAVLLLQSVADEKMAPLFLKGLRSNNPLIRLYSAGGLAVIGDVSAIAQIVTATVESHIKIDDQMMSALASFEKGEAMIQDQLRGTRLLPSYQQALQRKKSAKTKRESR